MTAAPTASAASPAAATPASAASSASANAARPAAASTGRTVLLLVAAAAVAIAANMIVATAALAAGATPGFAALGPTAVIPSSVIGILIGYAGWRLVRRLVPNAASALRVIVPVAAVLSFTPDLILLATGFIPGATVTAVVGLMLMHLVIVGVGVPVFQRIAPVVDRA